MGPLQRYRDELATPGFVHDAAQERAAVELDRLYAELCAARQLRGIRALLPRFGAGRSGRDPLCGVYLWGGVGRGKTHLMDLFCDCLPTESRMRIHFHRFMQSVHRGLRDLSGQKNPLGVIAGQIAGDTRLICFDEFFVSDITDAMILAGLFGELFRRGVTLVATSNSAPDELYRDGLQRQRFLPAIAMIKRHTRVVHVDGAVDHRLRRLQQAELYHCPLDERADQSLMRSFLSLAPEPGAADQRIEVEGRSVQARQLADDVVWFDFRELCDGPRSQNDYIELARVYHAVLISNVPCFRDGMDDQARRFINLVDEFYDRNVKLVLSAEAPPAELYISGRLGFEFQRTASRLVEMQSKQYLARAHRP